MEIRDYWGTLRTRLQPVRGLLWIAAAAPALAALVAVAVVLTRPVLYRATATVVVPVQQSVGSPIAAVDQSVADFLGAVRSDAVIALVAQSLHVSRSEIEQGLSTSRLGTSSLVEVSFEAPETQIVTQVVWATSRQALGLIQRAVVAPLDRERQLAEADYGNAESGIESFLAQTGLGVPSQVFRIQTSRLIALHDELGKARTSGDEEAVARLQALIAMKQAALTQQVVEYQRLQDARQRALNALFAADSRYLQATGQLTATANGQSMKTTGPERVSKLRELPAGIVASVVLGEVLSIALIALLALVRRQRTPAREPEALEPEEVAPPSVPA